MAALDLSAAAVKQRLSRGRGMLRERMAELVEGALRRSRPGRAFTVAVVTGLAALSAGARAALAGAGAAGAGPTAKAALGGAALSGGAGGVLGPLVGLLGGWFGTWLPAQLAPTRGERDYLRRAGARVLLVSLTFGSVLLGVILALRARLPGALYLTFLGAWFVTFAVPPRTAALIRQECRRRGGARVADGGEGGGHLLSLARTPPAWQRSGVGFSGAWRA